MNFFNQIVKRVANFSIQSYENNKGNLYDFYESNSLFKLCVLTASESLYNDLNKNKTKKTEVSLYNYFARAHINPTPFGVFNSVGLLEWGEKTNIFKTNDLSLFVKYDNLFLSSKIDEDFEKKWTYLSYCPNPTIHFVNDKKIGFYKSKIKEKDKIEIVFNEIDFDEDLSWLLDQFKNGNKIDSVIKELELQGFDRVDVEAFLVETIKAGVIIETFLFDSYASKLNSLFEPYYSNLINQKKHDIVTGIDIDNFRKKYSSELDRMFQDNDSPKNFYAINSFDFQDKGILDTEIKEKINQYIDFVTQYNSNSSPLTKKINKFIDKLQERYNDGFIPINDIFNPYSGISYLEIESENKIELHKDILLKILNSTDKSLFLNLTTEKNIEIKSKKFPATFTVILETLISKKSGESVVYIRDIGYQSALAMISRFSDVTQTACEEIVKFEKEVNSDKIIAEVNCVGTFRSINISPTEQQYDFSLPINTAYCEASNPILISDIYAHLEKGNLLLVSKEHQKQILPKKVSAINSRLLESDVYNFLCDYELYNQEIYPVVFDFNLYQHTLPFIPRIYLCEGVLLYPAQLMLVYDNFNIDEFRCYLKTKIDQYGFSQNIIIKNSNNEIVIDIENFENLKKLYEKLKEKKWFYVKEYLYENFVPNITNGDENYAHELVVGVQNPHFKRKNVDYSKLDISYVNSQKAALISDWLYLELYCKSQANSEILNIIFNEIISTNKVDQFFFVNYYIPERHLRLRFKTESIKNKEYIINIVQDLKIRNIVKTYKILPYNQEVNRYGGSEMMNLTEIIFDLDSRDYLNNIVIENLNEKDLKTLAVLKIRNYLYFFNFTLNDAINFCEEAISNFSKEFDFTSLLRKEFNKEYSEIRTDLIKHKYETIFNNDDFKKLYISQLQEIKTSSSEIFWSTIHMSMNRHFSNNQRFNEFKTYYFTKCYLNQLKFTKNNNS
jgi:lantibiotic biosynthesis protein